ncbi:segregation/condensation protein A, partial [Corynebacterium accolens]|uniref:segregation and condensation protein A n=1 Tax=Corynebacterium accolens TaxID=38284 RepID=UPI0025430C34
MTQPEITGFRIALRNFEGPFDLLLQLIQAKKMDITDVALSEVTDEFVGYTRQLGENADLDETTDFLVVAATLLDLKAARLLPRGEVDDLEDLELLESRDLLFARLLQYKAYKQAADQFARWQREAQRSYPRAVSIEEQFAELLPPVTLGHTPASFAEMAAGVFRPRPPEEVATGHIHGVAVSVPEQAGKILETLKLMGAGQWTSFSSLTRDCTTTMHIVGRVL